MAKLTFDCAVPCAIFHDGQEWTGKTFVAAPNGQIMLSVLPALGADAYLAYTVVLTVQNDFIISSTGGAEVLEWGHGEYDVLLRPPKLPIRHTPLTLAQSGDKTFATLYDDGEMHLMCEGDFFLVRDVPRLAEYRLSTSCNGEFLALLTGRTDSQQYVLTVSGANGGRVLHEHLADKIDVTDGGIVVHEHLRDMMRRIRISTYSAEGLVHRSFQRTERTLPSPLVAYALLEALLAKDDECALGLLCNELSCVDGVREFFGEFDEIAMPRGPYPDTAVAVYRHTNGVHRPRIFDFEVSDGLIHSVREISIP